MTVHDWCAETVLSLLCITIEAFASLRRNCDGIRSLKNHFDKYELKRVKHFRLDSSIVRFHARVRKIVSYTTVLTVFRRLKVIFGLRRVTIVFRRGERKRKTVWKTRREMLRGGNLRWRRAKRRRRGERFRRPAAVAHLRAPSPYGWKLCAWPRIIYVCITIRNQFG